MSQRLTNILGFLTLFAIMGAIWVMFGEDPTRDQGARGERTFAGLEERINEVAVLQVKRDDTKITIEKSGGDWHLKERGGYLVDSDKVRAVLRGIALSARREPKTANKSRYARLGLGNDALNIELRDDTSGVILDFDMGTRKDTRDGRSLTYVSQERDTRSWLVTELAETSADAGWWLRRPVLSIDQKRFSDVIIGGAWLTRKLADENFSLQGKRADEAEAGYWVLGDLARLVSSFTFDDVRQLANPLVEAKSVVEFSTYDGLSLKLSLYEMDGSIWAQVHAKFDATLQNEGSGGELPAAPADGAAEAQAIMAAVRGWVFKLSETDAAILQRTRADFLSASED